MGVFGGLDRCGCFGWWVGLRRVGVGGFEGVGLMS